MTPEQLERHLLQPRPEGHGWTRRVLNEAKTSGFTTHWHLGDHKALGHYAGHTHGGTP